MKNLNKNIYVLLVLKKINNFTISELKDAYIVECNDYKAEDEARKFIYRQVYKLVGCGYLTKTGPHNTSRIKYHQTESFNNKFSTDGYSKKLLPANEVDLKPVLMNKLFKYRERLISSIAESEEYQRLCNQYPYLLKTLKPQLELSKNKTYRFLGKITAIEKTLSSNQL
ncbi:MAG: hypothetical protein V5789_11840 [Colwellia sp.]